MSNEQLERAMELLRDCHTMLLDIKRNQEMPPFAQTQQQYVALGHEIGKFFTDIDEGAYRGGWR